MGNAQAPQRWSSIPREQRFSVQLLSHSAGEDGDILYEFFVEPPAGLALRGQSVRRSFKEFSKLDAVVAQRHCGLAPRLPRKEMLFARRDATFVTARAAGLAAYLEALLVLEPLPRMMALRRFLGIHQPFGPLPDAAMSGEGGSSATGGPLVLCGGLRLSVGLVATVLAFLEVSSLFQACGGVCQAMHGAVRHPQCWSTLRFCSGRAERWLDALSQILLPVSGCLQALALDIGFENPRLAVALPGGLIFGMLRCLSLRFTDYEAANLAAELLECVDSPSLRKVALEGVITTELLSAACRIACAALGGLTGLALSWMPSIGRPVQVDEGAVLAMGRLLDASPLLEELKIGIQSEIKGMGLVRSLAALYPPDTAIPNTQPLLASTACLASLQHLTFDFLSSEALACIQELADRSLCVRTAKISGVSQLSMSELDDALVLLLAKLGDELEEFELNTELPESLQPYTRGFLRARVGALPECWHGRESLRSLAVNCTAFDDNGVLCIADNCPQLHTLLLDRCEYWTDAVAVIITQQLPELQRFRLRKSSMLSDQALYTLGEAAERLRCLELETSFSMSRFATEQLRVRMGCGAEEASPWDMLLPSVRLLPAVEAFDQRGQGAMLRILGPPDDEIQHDGAWCNLTRHRKLSIGRW